jgi:hypothetical protein
VGYIYITKFINMKKSFLSVLISLVILPSFINAQEVEKQKLATLYSRIPIVKYVDLGLTKTGIDYLVSRGVNENQDLIVLKEFIKVNFGWDLIVTEEQRKDAYSNSSSICNIVGLKWEIGTFASDVGAYGHYPITIQFDFCDGTSLHFDFQMNVNGFTYSYTNTLKRALAKNLANPLISINPDNLLIKQNKILLPNQDLDELLKNKVEKSEIEGVYKLYSNTTISSINKVAIIKSDDKFYILNIESLYFIDDWQYGEIRGELMPTASDKFMIGKLSSAQKKDIDISLNIVSKGLIEIENQITKDKLTFVKLF